jgi:hypothetical protein
LDADKGTLSFAKNGGELRLAFTDLPTNVELFPVVVFYSLNPGEKVRPYSGKPHFIFLLTICGRTPTSTVENSAQV